MNLVKMIQFSGLSAFVLILSIGILEVHSNLLGKEYAQLISDVRKLYDTSSVLILHNDKLENVGAIGPIYDIVQWFSTSGIPSLTANIIQLSEVQSYYAGHIKRQLYVVFLRKHETVKEFENVMQNTIVSGPVWLIIFRPLKGKHLLIDYCMKPRGNPFNLAFNTEMLVKCYNEETLREWYSMYENETKVFDLATWDPVNRLKLLNDKSLYLRRNHTGGISLRVVAVNGSTLVAEQFGKLGGFFGKIVEELSGSMNFKIKQIQKEIVYGSWNRTTKEWSGIMKQLHKKNADLSASDMAMSTRRLDDVDFTIPLITSRVVLCFREPNATRVQQLGYFKTFNNQIWSCIVALIVITSIFLTMIKVKTKQYSNLRVLFCDNYLNVWRIFCQQGLPEFPTMTSLRMVYFSIFISALIISAIYSASLISYLTVPSTILPFTTLKGFVNDGTYQLIVLKQSVHYDIFRETNDQLLKDMRKLMKVENELPATEIEALIQVCSSKTAFYSTEETIISQKRPANCKLTWIETGNINCLSIPLSKRNQYAGIINFHLSRFLDSGMLHHLRNKRAPSNDANLNTKYTDVTISSIAPILNIIIVGIALSVLLFIAEKIYFLCTTNKYYNIKM